MLSVLALVTADADKRRRALAKGEALLEAGSVSHNYLHFYRLASLPVIGWVER